MIELSSNFKYLGQFDINVNVLRFNEYVSSKMRKMHEDDFYNYVKEELQINLK